MERVNRILAHPLFVESLKKIEAYEKNRSFCHHDMTHFLNVARIGWIYVCENGLEISKEDLYCLGLLHDIGRSLEYERGISHEEGSIQLMKEILPDCGYTAEEIQVLAEAVKGHRGKKTEKRTGLCEVLFLADKLSRNCFDCKAKEECNWPDEKKVMKVTI